MIGEFTNNFFNNNRNVVVSLVSGQPVFQTKEERVYFALLLILIGFTGVIISDLKIKA